MYLVSGFAIRYFIAAAAIVVAALVGFVIYACVSAQRMKTNFDKLKTGMTDEDVVAIMGVPNSENTVSGILVCRWERKPIVGISVVRTVYFKDGVVDSIPEGQK